MIGWSKDIRWTEREDGGGWGGGGGGRGGENGEAALPTIDFIQLLLVIAVDSSYLPFGPERKVAFKVV